MNDIDQKYYDQLFQRVQALIEEPRYPDDGQLIIHVYQSETWGKPSGWTAYQNTDTGKYHVNRVQWKSKHDLKRMNVTTQPANPTLTHTSAVLHDDRFTELLEIGAKIRVPLFKVQINSGFDGSHYGVYLPPPQHSPIQSEIRLSWWENGSKEWAPFAGWILKLIELFESAF